MRRAFLLLTACFLLLGTSECEKTFQSPAYNVDRCHFEPWRPNC